MNNTDTFKRYIEIKDYIVYFSPYNDCFYVFFDELIDFDYRYKEDIDKTYILDLINNGYGHRFNSYVDARLFINDMYGE